MAMRLAVLGLYKELMRTTRSYQDTTFRNYAQGRIRNAFRREMGAVGDSKIESLSNVGRAMLAKLKNPKSLERMSKADVMKKIINYPC